MEKIRALIALKGQVLSRIGFDKRTTWLRSLTSSSAYGIFPLPLRKTFPIALKARKTKSQVKKVELGFGKGCKQATKANLFLFY